MENVPTFIARTQQTEVNRVLQLFDRLFHLGPTDELLFHDASWTGDAAVRVCRLWTNLRETRAGVSRVLGAVEERAASE